MTGRQVVLVAGLTAAAFMAGFVGAFWRAVAIYEDCR